MSAPRFETERLLVTMLAVDDAPRMRAFYEGNRAHLERWMPAAPEGFYTDAYWQVRLEKSFDELAADRSVRLVLCDRADPGGPLVGTVSVSEIVRGSLQQAYLGYNVAAEREGRGLMREGLERVVQWAFDGLGLHRIAANYQPTNERSGQLLRRLGFVVEGYARDYLLIDGQWRDHVLTAKTNPHWAKPAFEGVAGTRT